MEVSPAILVRLSGYGHELAKHGSYEVWRRWRELHSRWSALRADALLSWLHRLVLANPARSFKACAVLTTTSANLEAAGRIALPMICFAGKRLAVLATPPSKSCAPGLVGPQHMGPVFRWKLAVFFLLDLLDRFGQHVSWPHFAELGNTLADEKTHALGPLH